jgi:hypothetical protein
MSAFAVVFFGVLNNNNGKNLTEEKTSCGLPTKRILIFPSRHLLPFLHTSHPLVPSFFGNSGNSTDKSIFQLNFFLGDGKI